MKYIDNVQIAYNIDDKKFYLVKYNNKGQETQRRILSLSEINQFLNYIFYYDNKFDLDLFKESNHIPRID